MARSDDISLALVALSIISEGLSAAHATDVQFRIAELEEKQNQARVDAALASKNVEMAWTMEREAKQDYYRTLEQFDKYKCRESY